MATTGPLHLSVWRNDDVYEFPLRVRGPNLTGVALHAQIRLAPDTPDAPLVDLLTVTNANAEGIRLAGVSVVDGVNVNDLRIRLNKSTRQGLPYAGEIGDGMPLAWAFQIAGRTRIVGNVVILAHAIGSDAAPLNRPPSLAGVRAAAPAGGATLTISEDDVAEITIDGADLVGLIADEARDARDAVKPIYGNGPPAPGIGIEGSWYRDMTDPLAPLEWFKTSAGWQGPSTLKGNPGGDASQVGTFAEISTLAIDAAINAISVTGTTVTGDEGNGRRFIYDAAVDAAFVAANPGAAVRSSNGRGFREILPSPPTAFDFRLYGDGASDVSGAAIDFWQAGGGYVPETGAPYVVAGTTPIDNLHGPADLKRDGGFITLPGSPLPFDQARKILSLLSTVRNANGGIALLGTSINEGYNFAAPNGPERDFFTGLRNLFNFAVGANNNETLTNFSDMIRYGVSHSGGSVGLIGPVGRPWIMQPGDWLEHEGAYPYNEVFHETDPAHGKLVFSFNGVDYKTIDCAANEGASDVCSFPTATASAAFGTHRIRCIDGPLQITGLLRLTNSATASPFFARMAVAGTSTKNIATRIQSWLKIGAGPTGGRSLFIFDHMINDFQASAQAVSVADYRSTMTTFLKAVLDAGHYALCLTGMKPDPAVSPGHGETWEAYMAALRDVCETLDVQLIDMDVWDWKAKGFLGDGIHPTVEGARARNRIVLREMASIRSLKSRLYPAVPQFESFILPIGDEATLVAAGAGKIIFRAPYAFRLTNLRGSVSTVSSNGNVQIDLKVAGGSILSQPLYVGQGDRSSTAAAAFPVIASPVIPDDAETSIDIVTAGTGTKGLKVVLTGYRIIT